MGHDVVLHSVLPVCLSPVSCLIYPLYVPYGCAHDCVSPPHSKSENTFRSTYPTILN